MKFMISPNILNIFRHSVVLVGTIYPTPPLGQDMTQGQFLSGVQQVLIQSLPSPRLVA